MHRIFFAVVCVTLGATSFALRAEDAPATAPASSGAETLVGGQISYTPPPAWKLIGKRADDKSVGYAAPEERGEIVITAAPQQTTIPNALGPRLATQIKQAIAADAQKGNIETLEDPKVEDDKRFLLKLHDRYRAKGKSVDRLQIYRGVGKNLVSVVVRAYTEDAAQAKPLFDLGEKTMLSIRLGHGDATGGGAAVGEDEPTVTLDPHKGGAAPVTGAGATTKPVLFPEAKLRVTPPAGWKAEPTGAASGLIVVWRDANDESNLITLTYRPVPAEAKKDPKLRDMAIDQLAAGEKPSFQAEGAKPAGPTQPITDKRFIRKTRSDYKLNDSILRVTFRQLRAGDGVVSITSAALSDKADAVDALADKVATEVRATSVN